jgi:hypothetical protein
MMKVCEECCQRTSKEIKCLCQGGQFSTKFLGLVEGCVVYNDNKRCKKECKSIGICNDHYKKVL